MKPKSIARGPGKDPDDSSAPWEGGNAAVTSQPRHRAVQPEKSDRAPGTNTLNRLGVLPEARKFAEADRFKPPPGRPVRPIGPTSTPSAPPPRQGPPPAEVGPDAVSAGDAFWQLPVDGGDRPVPAEPHEYLSGPSHLFDAATGWDFAALSGDQIAAVEAQRGSEPARRPAERRRADTPPAINLQPAAGAAFDRAPPKIQRVVPEEGVARARELLSGGQAEEAVDLLERLDRDAPGDPNVQTWLEYGVRRLMKKHCPGATPDDILVLNHPLNKLQAVASPAQSELLGNIDGRSTLMQVRAATMGLPTARFWAELGRLHNRGWVRW